MDMDSDTAVQIFVLDTPIGDAGVLASADVRCHPRDIVHVVGDWTLGRVGFLKRSR